MFPTQRSLFRFMVILTWLSALIAPTMSASVRAAPLYTNVGGPIISDTTWTLANSPYIVTSNIQVMTGVTLTIEAGVVVKFNSAKMMEVDGTLIARGTLGNLVTFTSSQPSPQPGDWKNIKFATTAISTTMDADGNYISGSILQYSIVEYGGGDQNNDPVNGAIDAYSLLIDHCIVRNNNDTGIYAWGSIQSPSRVSNSTISHNSTSSRRGGGISLSSQSYASGNVIIGNVISGNSGYFGGGIQASGTVMSNTITGNSALVGGGISFSSGQIKGNVISGNTATYSGGGGIDLGCDSTVENNVISGNSANYLGGGILMQVGCDSHSYVPIIANNIITGNLVATSPSELFLGIARGGGMALQFGVVKENIISGNKVIGSTSSGGGLWGVSTWGGGAIIDNVISDNSALCTGSYCISNGGGMHSWGTVMSNTITGNRISAGGQGSGVYLTNGSSFTYNTVVGNATVPFTPTALIGGLAFYREYYSQYDFQVHYNNLYGNSNYDVVVPFSTDISGTNNYFGTTSYMDINNQIYDWYDDSARGKFQYVPYLQQPDPNAPLAPPLNLKANFQNDTAALSWDPIPSVTTGYGYKIYYDNDASGPPYNGTGATQGNSPIDVGNATSYTLSGLGNSIYYIAVTTYDTHGRESWYSNVVNSQKKVYLPLVLRNP